MLWLDDLWSFEGILKHLRVVDVVSLIQTCRSMCKIVRVNCNSCQYLNVVATNEIDVITDTQMFSSLRGFRTLTLTDRMTVTTLRKLLKRWGNWNECVISTRGHTRKALILWLTAIRGVRSLNLCVANRDAQRFARLRDAIQCFARHNAALSKLKVQGCATTASLAPFLRLPLQDLDVNMWFRDSTEIGWLIASMPESLKFVTLRNSCDRFLTPFAPYFMEILATRSNIAHLRLVNCMRMSVTSVWWTSVLRFCERTSATRIEVDMLRCDCVEILAERGIHHVASVVIGVPSPLHVWWRAKMPPLWNLHLL